MHRGRNGGAQRLGQPCVDDPAVAQAAQLGLHRLPHPGGRLAGGRGQDPNHRVGLARAGTPGDDRHPLGQCAPCRKPLQVRAVGAGVRPEEVVQHPLQPEVRVVPAPPVPGVPRQGPAAQVTGDQELVVPVPLEVHPPAVPHQRPERWVEGPVGAGHDGRALEVVGPVVEVGPGQLPVRCRGVVAVEHLPACPPELHADVSEARRPGGEGQGEEGWRRRNGLEPHYCIHQLLLEGPEHPGLDEWSQQGRGSHRGAVAVPRRAHHHAVTGRRPSSSSLSSSTIAGAIAQSKTPWGQPSVVATPGPVMPRTNRYEAPPRWVSGR